MGYASMALIIAPCFFTFSELINEHCVEKLDMECDGGGAEKLRRRRDWSVDDFDAVEIRRRKSTKFDGAGVYYWLTGFLAYFIKQIRLTCICYSLILFDN